jgi:Ca-activated chloride channel family protein
MRQLSFLFTTLLLLMSSISYAGGFLIVMPNKHSNPNAVVHPGHVNPALFPLETRSTQIDAKIFEQTATTTIKQVFFNPTGRRLEAYFLFPVPKGVVINDFKMSINGKMQPAELLDASKARQIYEQIVRRAKDPALLEYYDQKMFRVRIFPIEPNSEQRIELTYSETLQKDNGTIAYHFPLNTAKYAAKPLQNLSLRASIEGNDKLKTIYCPTHEAEIIRKGDKNASVGFEMTNVRPDRDFQLYYNMDNSKIGLSLLNYQKGKEDGYFFMNISPGFGDPKEVVEKDVVFVMDKSGSMSGEKMEQAQKALKFCINNLNKGDRFEVVPFSTEATSLFGHVKDYNKDNKAEAIEFIDDLRAIGGTNIDEALELAMKAQQSKTDRPFFIIFMTDGKPTIGETTETALLDKVKSYNKENVRIFTFGIGVDLNTHLLDKLTEMSNGYRTYVLEDEDIEIKVSDFYAKASSPVLTDLKVDFDRSVRVSEVYPKQMPDLFKGATISLMGRYKGHGKTKVTVTGKVNGKEQKFTYEIDFEKDNSKHEFVPNLWAARTVGYLLDQIRLHGENEELKQEVIRLAKKHGIITPYTSYLILEDEALASNNRPRPVRPDDQLLRPRALNAPTIANDLAFDEVEEVVTKSAESRKRSGKSSVRASKELQEMNLATNMGAANQGASRLEYKDNSGTNRNLGENIVNVGGRAVYNNNNTWLDADVALDADAEKDLKVNRIQFNSEAYFKLMKREGANEFLALGRNVRFKMDDEVFEIFE